MIWKIFLFLFFFLSVSCSSNVETNQFTAVPQIRALEISPDSGQVVSNKEFPIEITGVLNDGRRVNVNDFAQITGLPTNISEAGALATLTKQGGKNYLHTLASGVVQFTVTVFNVRMQVQYTIQNPLPPVTASTASTALFEMLIEQIAEGAEEEVQDPNVIKNLLPAEEIKGVDLEKVELPKPVGEPEQLLVGLPVPDEDARECSLSIQAASHTYDPETGESLFIISGFGFRENAEAFVNGERCNFLKIIAPKSKRGIRKFLCKKKGPNCRLHACQIKIHQPT